MTSLCKNLAALLLFLIASPLPRYHPFTHAASSSPPVTPPRIIYMGDTDSDEDDEGEYPEDHSFPPEVVSSVNINFVNQAPTFCQYNPCLEDQEPCTLLSDRTGCRCPGLSRSNERPHPPRIQALQSISAGKNTGKVEVQWCAPFSVVSGYRVVVEGSGGEALQFGDGLRRGLVGPLEAGTKVCVEAVNSAGHSSPTEFSCKRYDPPDHKMLAWVIGGGVALLLLIIAAAVILWKLNICQKGKRNSPDGLGNPSYSTEGTL